MSEWIIAKEHLPETDDEELIGYDHFRCSEYPQKLSNTTKTITLPICNKSAPFYVYPITSYNYRNYYSVGLNYVKT